jgi:uncharacterized protein YkwD
MVVLIHITAFSAEADIKVVVDGAEIVFEQEPIIVEGRVMAPVEPIAEATGWDVNINSVGIYLKNHGDLEIIPGRKYYTIYKSVIGLTEGWQHISRHNTVGSFDMVHFNHGHYPTKEREICSGDKSCVILDEESEYPLTVKPAFINDVLFVAVRDLAEAVYAETSWDGASFTATVTSGTLPFYDGEGLPEDYREWLLQYTFEAFRPHGVIAPWDTPEQTEDEFTEVMEAEILRLINEIRAAEGLNPILGDPGISTSAQIRVEEIMVDFTHTRPNGESPSTAYSDLPYDYGSENILKASMGKKAESAAKFAVDIWMNSPGHRANILNPDFLYMGVAVVRGEGNTVYCAQGFMK